MNVEEQQAWLDLECAHVSFVLQQAGVSHLFIKGDFAHEILQLPEPARSVDVDVLVPPRDASTAREALQGAGWRDVLAGTRRSEVAGHSSVLRRAQGPEVDLHHTYPGAGDGHALWGALAGHSQSVIRAHRTVQTPAPAGHALLLALTCLREGPGGHAARKLQLVQEAHLLDGSALADALGMTSSFDEALPMADSDGARPKGSSQSDRRRAAQDRWRAARQRGPGGVVILIFDEAFPSPAFMRLMQQELGGGPLPVLYVKRWVRWGRLLAARDGRADHSRTPPADREH